MSPAIPKSCSTCEKAIGADYPFCPECGRLSPSFVSRGSVAVELEEVPSQRLRNELVSQLKSWFPSLDALDAADRLKSGRTLLIQGISEESADRILNRLKAMKVPGRISRAAAQTNWGKRLLNPGLAVSVGALFIGWWIGGISGLVLALLGAAVTPAWALLKGSVMSPLISFVEQEPDEDLLRLSLEYSRVIDRLSAQDRETLNRLTSEVFDVQHRLQSESLASVAAGAESGELHSRLSDSLTTAISIAGRLVSATGDEQPEMRQELKDLESLVHSTGAWYRSIEGEGVKESSQLAKEMKEVTESIDNILEDVKSPPDDSSLDRRRTLG
jgi:hypothetical protein